MLFPALVSFFLAVIKPTLIVTVYNTDFKKLSKTTNFLFLRNSMVLVLGNPTYVRLPNSMVLVGVLFPTLVSFFFK